MTTRVALLGCLVAAALLAPGPAAAQNEPVRFFNRAGAPATALHVVRSGQTTWSANLLRDIPLATGAFASVRLGDGAGCRFDVRLVLQDGREVVNRDADVCATRSVDIAPQQGAVPVPQPAPGLPQVGGPDQPVSTTERPRSP